MTQAIDQTMQQAIERGVFSSASLLAGREGEILHHAHYGRAREGICFDIASLTKPVCTATLALTAVREGRLKWTDTLYQWVGGARQPEHRRITVAHLLNHTSGLPAWRPFYREVPIHKAGTPEAKRLIVDCCLREPVLREPGSLCEYSDLGFILLGEILEEALQAPLDLLFEEKLATPFGLKETFFIRPQVSSLRSQVRRFAPTEDCPWRNKVIQGEVHDQNAYAMGGVAGHAGLFSTTGDLHQFTKEFLKQFHQIIDSDIVRTTLHASRFTNYVLGWDTPTFGTSSAGRHFSPHSIGHMGYTGCSIWIDLDRRFWVILLTNRIHPSTANEKIKSFRPRIHNLIWKEFNG